MLNVLDVHLSTSESVFLFFILAQVEGAIKISRKDK